jgi:transcriptional regulator with XRE-family HTH domain
MATQSYPYSEETRRVIGGNIKRLREESAKSVIDLASSAQIARGYWYEIESGLPNVTIEMLQQIANALSVTVRDLLEPAKPKGRKAS